MRGLIKYGSVKQSPQNQSSSPKCRWWPRLYCPTLAAASTTTLNGLKGEQIPADGAWSSAQKVSKEPRDNGAAQVTLINDLLLHPGGIQPTVQLFIFGCSSCEQSSQSPGELCVIPHTQSKLGTVLVVSHDCGTLRQINVVHTIFQQTDDI